MSLPTFFPLPIERELKIPFVPTTQNDVSKEWIENEVLRENVEGLFKVVRQTTHCMTDGDDRQGFSSLVVRTETIVAVQGEQKLKKFCLFVKMFPSNARHREMIKDLGAFEREIYSYTELLQDIREAQDSDTILEPFWPKCFYTARNPVTNISVVVLDDLTRHGYRMMNKKTGMNREHLICGLRALARTHALTYNLKTKLGSVDTLVKHMPLVTGEPMKSFASFIDSSFEVSIIRIRKLGEEELADRMEAYRKKYPTGLFQRLVTLWNTPGKTSTFVQGDCWINNMMFRHEIKDDITSKPVDVKLIDLQAVRYAHPCTDLHYFLASSSYRVEKEPYEELENEYYNAFFDVLGQVGNKLTQEEYSFEDFHTDFNKFREYGFIIGQMFIGGILTEEQKLPNLDDSNKDPLEVFLQWMEDRKQESVPPILGERLKEFVKEMAEFNVI